MEKIALITDLHANLEALEAVLKDIKNKNIDKIYSLGDVIGLGNHPKECLDLLIENKIPTILGNAEEYVVLGADCFEYLKKHSQEKYDNAIWTKNELSSYQLEYLKKMPHTIELNINNKKIALCHFPVDVRYDFRGVWEYAGVNVNHFFDTNTQKDLRFKSEINDRLASANNDPLFFGKTIDNYDIIIFGHYHFYRHHHQNNIDFYSLNATGVAIEKQAKYYIVEPLNDSVKVSEQAVDYDYKSLYESLNNTNYPNIKVFKKYINMGNK